MSKSPKKKYSRRNNKKVSTFDSFRKPAKNWSVFILRNVFILILFFFIFKNLYDNSPGYKWLNENFISENMRIMRENPDYTLEQKYEVKFGFFAKYVNLIVENTPDSSIILMPADSVVKSIDAKYNMNMLGSKRHTGYFLYPRKAVYMNNDFDSVYMDNITHVAIVNGVGYEYLPYNVKNKSLFTILPIKLEQSK